MDIITRIRNWAARSFLTQPPDWLVTLWGGPSVKSGVTVTEISAMRSTAVFASVRLIGGTIASLPLPVYRQSGKNKERATDSNVYQLLHDRPNPMLSSFQWRQTMMAHILLYGNSYNEIEYDNRGNPKAIWMLPPWRVKMSAGDYGERWYEITLTDGTQKMLASWQVLHFANISLDGKTGISCIRAGAESVGLSLAAEEFGARFFGEGANMGGIIEYPGKLSDTALNRYKESVREGYSGLGKAHKLMLLEEGLKYHRVGIPPNEAQMLETRNFQIAEIGRLFGISQLHKIGDLSHATYSNIESQNIEFVVDTIRPHLINIEQEIKYKLFNNKPLYAEHVIEGLLRGDTASRYQSYAVGRQWGWLSANDIRQLENMNPLPEDQGDLYMVPLNMVPAQQMTELKPEPDNNRTEKRNGDTRKRVADSYKKIFIDASARILRREEADVMRKATELLGRRDITTLEAWLEEFYRKHADFVMRQMLPPISALAEAIQAEVASEIDFKAGMTPELEKFVSDYAETYTIKHIKDSEMKLRKVMRESYEAGEDTEESLRGQFEEWNDKRPAQIANEQVVQVNGAISRFVMAAAGLIYLRVRNTGSKTCPFCEQLDGRIVGIDNPIIPAGHSITASDGSGMKIYGKKMNPPFHTGCVCVIEPN